jgi:hypothetical protein
MTKIKFITIAALALCSASCATTTVEDVKVAPGFDSKVGGPGEGGHRGAYMTTSSGEKLQIGEWIYWYPNGQKKLRAYYKLGVPHGRWMMWDEAGVLRLEGSYRLGRGTGEWIAYYGTGRKIHQGRFSNDLEVGHWVYWYYNGNKKMEGNFRYGEFHGKWTFYAPDGTIAFTAKYNNGRLLDRQDHRGDQ